METADFQDVTAFHGRVQQIFDEAGASATEGNVMEQLFSIEDTTNLHDTIVALHAVEGVGFVPEGADYPSAQSSQGGSLTLKQRKYGLHIPVTKELMLFWDQERNNFQRRLESAVESTYQKIYQSAADVLLRGYESGYTDIYGQTISGLGLDGQTLFSTSHQVGPVGGNTTTYSNIIQEGSTLNPELSREAVVETRAQARKYRDITGTPRPIRLDTLIVGPELEDLATQIVNSDLIPFSSHNNANTVVQNMKVVVWDHLAADGEGNEKGAHWFLADGKQVQKSLVSMFAQRPTLKGPFDTPRNGGMEFTIDTLYWAHFAFPAFIWGSNGTNTA